MPDTIKESQSSEFSLDEDLQTQISFLLNNENRAFSVDEICHSVERSTNDREVVLNCLNTLEYYGQAKQEQGNPLMWSATGRELVTKHHQPNDPSSQQDTGTVLMNKTYSSQRVKQDAALESLQDYSSPQSSPGDLAVEDVHGYSSPQKSPNLTAVEDNELKLSDTGKAEVQVTEKDPLQAENNKETHTISPLKKLPPLPSASLLQNLRKQVPGLDPIGTFQHRKPDSEACGSMTTGDYIRSHVGYLGQDTRQTDIDVMKRPAEEPSEQDSLYQQLYLILEMGDDYKRQNEEFYDDTEYCNDNGNWDCEQIADYYREGDEPRYTHQAENCAEEQSEELIQTPSTVDELNTGHERKQLVLNSSSEQLMQTRLHSHPGTHLEHDEKIGKQNNYDASHQELSKSHTRPISSEKQLEDEAVARSTSSLGGHSPLLSSKSTNQDTTTTSVTKKGPSAAPPPPSAALFQSLMAKCARPPAPVVMKPAQSPQFGSHAPTSQLRAPAPASAFSSPTSFQVNRPLLPHGTTRSPNPSSHRAGEAQIRHPPPLMTSSGTRQQNLAQPCTSEHSPRNSGKREERSTSRASSGIPATSGFPFSNQSSRQTITYHTTAPPRKNNFSTHKNPNTIHTATPSKLPPPPTADLFKNLVRRGPQALPTKHSSPVTGKQPGRLTGQESQILDYMKQEGKPCQVLQLARVLGYRTKKEVNPTLYHLQTLGRIYKLHDHPPTWKMRSSTGSYDAHPSPSNVVAPPPPTGVNLHTRDKQYPQSTPETTNPSSHSVQASKPPPLMASSLVGAPQKRKWEERSVTFDQGFESIAPPIFKGYDTDSSQEDLRSSAMPAPFSQPRTLPQSSFPRSDPSTQSGSAQVLNKVTFSAINKNPVSTLNEYAQKNNMAVTFELIRQGRGNRPCFEMAAKVGSRLFPSVTASNTKDARREAADLALRTILGQSAKGSGSSQPGEFRMTQAAPGGLSGVRTHFDLMAALSHHAFLQVAAAIPDKFAGRKVIACMIMKSSSDDSGHVVSLGAGNRCVTGQRLSMEGKTVNDSHAEIISRRALLRFFYSQLNNYYTSRDSIFVPSRNSSKLNLREGISFHLYISTAPCGDGALFTPREISSMDTSQISRQHDPTFTNKQQGILRTKIEDGEGTIPIDPSEGPQTWDGLLQGRRLRTMSCSDKICRWNILGLQGSLLSHLIEPIYLESLTLGYLYDHGHLSRAVCCRLQHKCDLSAEVPQPYHVNHPWLGRVTAYEATRETDKTNNLSVNWTIGDATVEVTDGRTGLFLLTVNGNDLRTVPGEPLLYFLRVFFFFVRGKCLDKC